MIEVSLSLKILSHAILEALDSKIYFLLKFFRPSSLISMSRKRSETLSVKEEGRMNCFYHYYTSYINSWET